MMSSTFLRFTKGCVAGFVASLMLQPLQVVKTSMQITPIAKKSNVSAEHHKTSFSSKEVLNSNAINLRKDEVKRHLTFR
jgi:hypothetical protein